MAGGEEVGLEVGMTLGRLALGGQSGTQNLSLPSHSPLCDGGDRPAHQQWSVTRNAAHLAA